MQRLILAASLAAAIGAGPALALAMSRADGGGVLLVVSAPDAGAREALIRRAGGRPVGPAQARLAGFATSERAGFADRLRAAGAWLVLDAGRLASLCGGET
jgi:hypothetical protein